MRWFEKLFEAYSKFAWRKFSKIIENTENIDDFFFIQVGANDGVNLDPIHEYILKYNWNGILIEPVEYLFDQLKKNYQNRDNLIFENIAIAEKDGYKDFYRIKEHENPKSFAWYNQLGTFNFDVLKQFRFTIPNFDNLVITQKIKCTTFQNLIKKHNVKKIDLLLIDTEGYDYEIIKLVDFSKNMPKMILYEHYHLNKADKKECDRLLNNHGYYLRKTFVDTFAYLP